MSYLNNLLNAIFSNPDSLPTSLNDYSENTSTLEAQIISLQTKVELKMKENESINHEANMQLFNEKISALATIVYQLAEKIDYDKKVQTKNTDEATVDIYAKMLHLENLIMNIAKKLEERKD